MMEKRRTSGLFQRFREEMMMRAIRFSMATAGIVTSHPIEFDMRYADVVIVGFVPDILDQMKLELGLCFPQYTSASMAYE